MLNWNRFIKKVYFLMNTDNIKDQFLLREIYEKLDEAEAQIKEGIPLIDSEKVFEKLKKKYIILEKK